VNGILLASTLEYRILSEHPR